MSTVNACLNAWMQRAISRIDRLIAGLPSLPEFRGFRFGGRADRFAEFLPDTEGIVASRHSPAAGYLIMAIAAMVATALLWAGLTEVEQVVRAEGRVEPMGRVKIVNHPNGGRVAEVLVIEGEPVLAGQPLLAFDAELGQAELDDLLSRWQIKAAEADRLRAEAMDEPPAFTENLAESRPDLIVQQTDLLRTRRQSRESRRRALTQAIERLAHEVESLIAERARLENSENMLGQQVGAVRKLTEQGLYPRLRLIAAERQLGELSGDIRKTGARLASAEAAYAESKSERDSFELEWRSLVLAELAQVEAERDGLAEAVRRQRTMLDNLLVRAPVDGIVQELVVAGAGQSVGSNQPLMKLVPTGANLVVRAKVDNQDIGYLTVGQSAKVKVQAFDFLRYGALEGEVRQIAADATLDQADGTLRYGITVETDKAELSDGETWHSVVPGMAVEVDLLVRERTILSYLTDRIFRMPKEAFQEG
ncbi:MAG: HlyD family type I secretion periplasmic adaptor subunit [Alphaproteobacteria bacterium]|nr:HlyD family type I secretion periplasmic adaptor subunit [Alphaproteobacteria bacterium]